MVVLWFWTIVSLFASIFFGSSADTAYGEEKIKLMRHFKISTILFLVLGTVLAIAYSL